MSERVVREESPWPALDVRPRRVRVARGPAHRLPPYAASPTIAREIPLLFRWFRRMASGRGRPH